MAKTLKVGMFILDSFLIVRSQGVRNRVALFIVGQESSRQNLCYRERALTVARAMVIIDHFRGN